MLEREITCSTVGDLVTRLMLVDPQTPIEVFDEGGTAHDISGIRVDVLSEPPYNRFIQILTEMSVEDANARQR
jgi:hypothetical protein